MKTLVPYFCLIVFLFSCTKDSHDNSPEEPVPNFYVSFEMADSSYMLNVGSNYTYDNEVLRNSNLGFPRYNTYKQRTSVLPLPYNANRKLVGFSFEIAVPECYVSCDVAAQMVECGKMLFQKGDMVIGNTGYTSDMAAPYEISYPGGVAIYWLSGDNKYFASTCDAQPVGNFFTIDSVLEQRAGVPGTMYTYEKIVVGRFRCRVFNPANKVIYKDLEKGRFRMPAWRTKD